MLSLELEIGRLLCTFATDLRIDVCEKITIQSQTIFFFNNEQSKVHMHSLWPKILLGQKINKRNFSFIVQSVGTLKFEPCESSQYIRLACSRAWNEMIKLIQSGSIFYDFCFRKNWKSIQSITKKSDTYYANFARKWSSKSLKSWLLSIRNCAAGKCVRACTHIVDTYEWARSRCDWTCILPFNK